MLGALAIAFGPSIARRLRDAPDPAKTDDASFTPDSPTSHTKQSHTKQSHTKQSHTKRTRIDPSRIDDDDSEPELDEDGVVVLPIEDSIDLHHFAPRDILNVVTDYLQAASEKGFEEVRLIHGRGKGVQRARIRKLLETHPLVVDFRDAPHTRGGWGATLAWLKPTGADLKPNSTDSAEESSRTVPKSSR